MSGRPRSRITRSDGCSVAARNASAPVSASWTMKPSSSKPVRRKRRIWISSSTTRTEAGVSLIDIGLQWFGLGRHRQMDGDRGAAVGAVAFDLDLAAVGGDAGIGDPQPKPGAGRGHLMARPAEEAAADLASFL